MQEDYLEGEGMSVKRKTFERICFLFAGIWLAQWLVAAYTLEVRFVYGGAVTLVALIIIALGLHEDMEMRK